MPTNTPNLNLIKPLVSEHYTVAVANANNDILDTAVGDVYTKSEVDGLVGGLAPQAKTYTKDEVDTQVGLLAPKDNPTFTGTQTLPNIVTNGIKFPATQVPSSDPNTLDDYEKGVFNPTIIGLTNAGTGQTYSAQIGKYVKIGGNVQVWGRVTLSNKGNPTGAILIGGMPFITNHVVGRIKGMIPRIGDVTGKTIDNVHGTYAGNVSGAFVIIPADSAGTTLDCSLLTNQSSFDFYVSYPTD